MSGGLPPGGVSGETSGEVPRDLPRPARTRGLAGLQRRAPWARRWAFGTLLLVLGWLAAAWWIGAWRSQLQMDRAVDSASAQARARALLVEDGLRKGLAQLDGMARLFARSPLVAQVAQGTGGEALLARGPAALRPVLESQPGLAKMNAFLALAAHELGVDLIVVMDGAGTCIASSNAGSPDSVVGAHRGDSDIFVRTRADGEATQFSVGRVTGTPGLYFSSAIVLDGRFVGAVVVKRNTPALAAMVGYEGTFVTDAQGVVIMARDKRLQLQALDDAPVFSLPPKEREALYQSARLQVLHVRPWDDPPVARVLRVGEDPQPQVIERRHMAHEALEVHVMQPVPELAALARMRLVDFVLLALAGGGFIAMVAAALGVWRSRRNVLDGLDQLARANADLSVQVAERRRAESLLDESLEYQVVHEARLRALLRSLPEQVWMKDRAGAYLAVNAEFERFQGLREGDVLGRTDHDVGDSTHAARFAEQDRATLEATEPLVFEDTVEAADGSGPRQLEITKIAVRDERGQVIGVVGIGRDMTDIRAAHEAMRRSEARFRATFETAGDAILIVRHSRVADCNRSAAELLGAESREALLGLSMALFAPERQPGGSTSREMLERYVEEAKSGHVPTIDWRCCRLDGVEFDAEITLSLFEIDGQRLLQAVLRDVSDRRRMVAALEAAKEEAERANRSKSVFLANMSHEIRTPLNAVLGFTQLLMADRKLANDVQARLRVIHSAGNRLLGLINDVLDLAKIESGGLQVLRAPFDVVQELNDIGHLFGTHARAKGLALQCEFALGERAVVEGDRTKFGQIVTNLLGNALKFTERGHISLHAWRDAESPDRLWVEVGDTGMGITAADLRDLFVPFRQGMAGHEKGGTGLGLALSRDMARAMGGDLDVASEAGAGTQVRFWLPLPASAGGSAAMPMAGGAQELDPQTPCTVLVIEDDDDSREVLVNLLRSAGCTVAEAVDGLDGLARCRAERFDIVFSDIRMPQMNGVEMMERLRADPVTRALPVVAVSASSLEHERRFYTENGFQDFIGKPYPFAEVYRALVEHAGVRLRPVFPAEAPEDGPAGDAVPVSLEPGVRDRLNELLDAAASGQLAAVGRLMAGLAPEAVGRERWRGFDEAAQAYDFQLLEQRIRSVLSQADAVP